MSAGPYPTKQMHEALKGRVAALEGGGGAAGNTPGPTLTVLSRGAPQVGATTVRTIDIGWSRRSVYLAGISLYGNVELDSLTLYGANRWEGRTTGYGSSELRRTVTGSGANTKTLFLLPAPVLITDGGVFLTLPEGATLQTYPTPPAVLPSGLTVKLGDVNDSPVAANISFTLYENPWPGLSIVPEPTDPTGNFNEYQANYTPPRLVEVVWPASGNPYLHVVVFSSTSGDGRGFYAPLTPGLPPQ